MGGGGVAAGPSVPGGSRTLVFRSENATAEIPVGPSLSPTRTSMDLEAVSNPQAWGGPTAFDSAMGEEGGVQARGAAGGRCGGRQEHVGWNAADAAWPGLSTA